MTLTNAELRLTGQNRQGLQTTNVTPIDVVTRQKLGVTHRHMDIRYSDALDLQAQVLASMTNVLNGVSDKLAGPLAPNKFRESLRGERPFNLVHLCRLAVSLNPKAKEAARAAVKFIAARATARWNESVGVKESAVTFQGHAVAAAGKAVLMDGNGNDALAVVKEIDAARAALDDLEHAVLLAVGGRRV